MAGEVEIRVARFEAKQDGQAANVRVLADALAVAEADCRRMKGTAQIARVVAASSALTEAVRSMHGPVGVAASRGDPRLLLGRVTRNASNASDSRYRRM